MIKIKNLESLLNEASIMSFDVSSEEHFSTKTTCYNWIYNIVANI